jgi:hypothetical protein
MKTYALCPISDRLINEHVARLNAAFTLFFFIGFAFTGSLWPLAFIFVDFLLRGTSYAKYSLIGISSRQIVRVLPLEDALINAGPKIFAARIGLLLTGIALLASISGANAFTLGVIVILGLFSFLEAAFGFCMACKIYPLLYKFLYNDRDA